MSREHVRAIVDAATEVRPEPPRPLMRELPPVFGRLHPRWNTPYVALLVQDASNGHVRQIAGSLLYSR